LLQVMEDKPAVTEPAAVPEGVHEAVGALSGLCEAAAAAAVAAGADNLGVLDPDAAPPQQQLLRAPDTAATKTGKRGGGDGP
jgi:hypothetical protein